MGEKRSQRSTTRTVLDPAQRKLRLKRFIESLDKDNFHEDLNLHTSKLPSFDDKPTTKKRKKAIKRRFPKSFAAMLEESAGGEAARYAAAQVAPSTLPARHFCTVCGYLANYQCIVCGLRYCSIPCGHTHSETRCLKWA